MRALALVAILCLTGVARADTTTTEPKPWYESKRRVAHLGIAFGSGVLYLVSEVALKPHLAPAECRWCDPTGFDTSLRNAILWGDPQRAATLSNVTGYVATPLTMLSLVAVGIAQTDDADAGKMIDAVLPVIETVAVSQILVEAVKFGVGRQRPYAHFAPPGSPTSTEDNLSFFSGHTALTFALVTSAGVVAHRYDLPEEKFIWGAGIPLALTTAYLRMAGDKHYITDVTVGAAFGIAAGIIIPKWSLPERMHVTANGVAYEW